MNYLSTIVHDVDNSIKFEYDKEAVSFRNLPVSEYGGKEPVLIVTNTECYDWAKYKTWQQGVDQALRAIKATIKKC